MISELYGWVRGIAVYLIIMSLVIKLLPEESYGKYIRHFMGVLLILVVLAPAIRLFRLDRLLERLERGFSASAGTEQFKDELLLMGEAYEEELIGQYEEALAESAAKELSRNGFEDRSSQAEERMRRGASPSAAGRWAFSTRIPTAGGPRRRSFRRLSPGTLISQRGR